MINNYYSLLISLLILNRVYEGFFRFVENNNSKKQNNNDKSKAHEQPRHIEISGAYEAIFKTFENWG